MTVGNLTNIQVHFGVTFSKEHYELLVFVSWTWVRYVTPNKWIGCFSPKESYLKYDLALIFYSKYDLDLVCDPKKELLLRSYILNIEYFT